jgi:hypothetical protein
MNVSGGESSEEERAKRRQFDVTIHSGMRLRIRSPWSS